MKRLPTKAEFKALLKLTHKWDEERNGLLVTADNWNELFFPALGCKYNAGVYNVYYSGYYWSATQSSEDEAMYLHFYYNGNNMTYIRRLNGHSVRLISDEPCYGYIDMGTGIYWAIENYHEGENIYFTWNESMAIQDKVNGTAGLLMKKDGNTPEFNISDTLNWEQRRYEIAKDVYLYRIANSDLPDEWNAKRALETADELIKQLKQQDNERD